MMSSSITMAARAQPGRRPNRNLEGVYPADPVAFFAAKVAVARFDAFTYPSAVAWSHLHDMTRRLRRAERLVNHGKGSRRRQRPRAAGAGESKSKIH